MSCTVHHTGRGMTRAPDPRRSMLALAFCVAILEPCIALRGAVPSRVSPIMTVANTAINQLPSGDFAACWPVALGQYNGGAAVFLARQRRILDPREEVLPVPIDESAVPLLSEAMQPRDISVAMLIRTCATLFGRNGGMYDNLPWGWSGDDLAKREAFQRSQGKGLMGFGIGSDNSGQKYGSAYQLLAELAEYLCTARILSLVIEEEESLSGGIFLGGSAYIQRGPNVAQGVVGGEKVVIEITTDEVVGVALSMGKQVYVDRDIWEGARMRPNFIMSGDGKMRMDVDVQGQEWASVFGPRQVVPVQPPAWTIKSRGALFKLSVEEKRGVLRSSGIKPPRKRALSGVEEKDDRDMEDMLLPLMDEAVRRDVLLARAWREGDFERAGELCADKSERHIVAEQLQMAIRDQDNELATILRERLEILESCRMDPTQDVGSYQKDLDADEWYLRNRRSSMQ